MGVLKSLWKTVIRRIGEQLHQAARISQLCSLGGGRSLPQLGLHWQALLASPALEESDKA